MNELVFDYRRRLAARGLLGALGVAIPTLLILARQGTRNAVVAFVVCAPIALAGMLVVLRRELREPRRLVVRGDVLEVQWARTSRAFDLRDVRIAEPRARSGSIVRAVRITASDRSFLVFENLSDFRGFLAIVGQRTDTQDGQDAPG